MFGTLVNRIRQEMAYQRDLAEMEAMDDRQLADIGVSRYELASALRQGRRDGASQETGVGQRRPDVVFQPPRRPEAQRIEPS